MGRLTADILRKRTAQVWIAVGVSLICAVLAFGFAGPYLGNLPATAIVFAGLLYLISHSLRAFRLALVSIDILGISGRSTALMHFATAPVGLFLPFKLGELLRLHQLWRLSGTGTYAVVTLLIDRMYDSLFLVPFLLVLLTLGNAPTALILLTLLAATIPLVVVVLGPKLLTEAQRYVVVHHNNPRTLALLPRINALRIVVVRATAVARRRALEISLLSFLIWLTEFLVCFVLISAFNAELQSMTVQAMNLLGERLVAPWWDLTPGSLEMQALVLSAMTLVLPWPLMFFLYLRRQKGEPRRMPADWQPTSRLVS